MGLQWTGGKDTAMQKAGLHGDMRRRKAKSSSLLGIFSNILLPHMSSKFVVTLVFLLSIMECLVLVYSENGENQSIASM
ncbi:hypothetical protein EGR_07457 [Echinococcus granulosus]|uniref:Uncharacterized protein n=1 Tax=Echinococcus granulosus TaxID=6210 RepID=W6U9G4_ECHGR|nr:hypothetical protein EGR_07457 [Echinococcus granulosus]EUB57650.1 hypothetical protein EGR_07457 [Echinococcus granulosus]